MITLPIESAYIVDSIGGLMYIHRWTPNGRKTDKVTSFTYQLLVRDNFRRLVRETAYNVCQLEAHNAPKDELWSIALCLYRQAVDSLKEFDIDAESFIKATYNPKTVVAL